MPYPSPGNLAGDKILQEDGATFIREEHSAEHTGVYSMECELSAGMRAF